MSSDSQIDLYTAGTPNGHKINITFEELGLGYNLHKIDIAKNEQKQDWFLAINPNGRIPAIVDHASGTPKRIFEGAAIQLYLVAKYDSEHKISFPYDSPEYWEVVEWLVWMQSGIGPMQGQANHFYRYAPEKIQYAIDRYQTETKRLYGVLDARLRQQEEAGQGLWIVGNKYTIADIACFSWVEWNAWSGTPITSFKYVQRWLETIEKRPTVETGLNVPEKFEMREAMKTKEGEEEYAKHHSNWVMQGMKDDSEKHK